MNKNNLKFSSLKTDSLSGLVVFLVALPLCLGIAVASGASPFAGIISGVIGGLIVGYFSGSNVSVSGPAAGLIAIVLLAIQDLGFETFLLAIVLAGILQLILGFAKAGTISNYFPSGVIEGMLTGIGIIIIKKELPHAIGYDKEHDGDFFNYNLTDSADSGFFNEIIHSLNFAHTGIIILTLLSIGILVAFNKLPFLKKLKVLPGALVVVVVGILLNEAFRLANSQLLISRDHLVTLPVAGSIDEFIAQFTLPNFAGISNPKVWITAATIAAVASIETLLCLEAGDKLDPLKRYSSANTELKAQGIGNIISGLIGGLPMTSVIVRTSANIQAGARTKFSAIFHGLLLLLTVVLIPGLLNKIPMACLAAILIMIGFKLASPKVFMHMWKIGKFQFIPFIVTVIGVVGIDLLKGVGIGLLVSVFFILSGNMKLAYFFKKEEHKEGEDINIDLAQEVSFLNKAAIKETLRHLPENSKVIISAKNTVYIDYDVLELIKDFKQYGSKDKNIIVELQDFKSAYKIENSTNSNHVS
ncbi:SulP family inorganic anion transporter [Flavobacterium glaciei]|uniref:MFS superfamily sulfate permease-like transporter n=1 Tax=Flavobacterium glaciei TaxID=386300 RepID=A0A562PRM0_9FLAO|nr:SulP family inorganic anion transporter [Flavobacterium glaciei]RDI53787.1 MFS superfamily sulfate permease-like transporter [Flavobacterium glaciei]TWI47013.1 MFS superfamily sulfate permease-like transporter [Flavobacterium glaciei]